MEKRGLAALIATIILTMLVTEVGGDFVRDWLSKKPVLQEQQITSLGREMERLADQLEQTGKKLSELASKDDLESLDDRMKSIAAKNEMKFEQAALERRQISEKVIRLEERSKQD